MVVKNATDTEAGLFIATLIRFAAHPRLGGHSGHGCGLVEASWELTTWKPDALAPVHLGRIILAQDGVKISGSEIEIMLETCKENKDLDFKLC